MPAWGDRFLPVGFLRARLRRQEWPLGGLAHWTGTRWLDTNNFAAQIRGGTSQLSGALAVIPGTSSVWGAGAISRSATATDSMVIVYGKLP